eukprot:1431980-Rhodomonas_salina.1
MDINNSSRADIALVLSPVFPARARITGSRLEPELGIGVRVMAKWKGGDAFPGQITAMNGDGTYAVQFDDGDYDGHIPESHIMPA